MSEPYVGEIRLFSFGFVPKGWAMCNGAQMDIQENQMLYAILGTNYGGNGSTYFNLPDLQGRVAASQGNSLPFAMVHGFEAVTLNINTMPQHTHPFMSSAEQGSNFPLAESVLTVSAQPAYTQPSSMVALSPNTCSPQGGNQPHNNIQPSLVMNYCIAIDGLFPSRN